jgi:choline dehydrogenase
MRQICFLLIVCLFSAFQAITSDHELINLASYEALANLKNWKVFNQEQNTEQKIDVKNKGMDEETLIDGAARVKKKFIAYDYIIVGNGTAGAVLARKLSDNFQNKVLVIEAGENRTDDPIVLSPNPFAFLNEITFNPKYAFNYSVIFNQSNGPVFIYSSGRMWGGSSAKNYLLAVRGTPAIYNFWALASGNARWSYHHLLPLMLGLETYFPNGTVPNLSQRGTNGPLDITQSPPINQSPYAIAESIITGAPLVSDYNDPTEGTTGISASQSFINPFPTPHRSFSINAFLPVGEVVSANGRGLNGRNLRIVSDGLVSRVLFKNRKAIGVEYILSNSNVNKVVQVYARKKIILCAGAIHSPAILQRSGIGDQALLNSLDIPVLVDNPHVGAHLMDHYGPVGRLATTVPGAVIGFIDERPYMPADNVRRIQTISTPADSNVTSVIGWILQPRSGGYVQIVTRDATVYPNIKINFYTDGPATEPGTDAYKAVSFYKILKAIANQLGVPLLFPPPQDYPAPFGPAPNDSLLLADASGQTTLNLGYHAVGTTRMATSIEDGVVDGSLHIFGVKNLMVADTSIEPLITDGNTAYAAYVIGLVAAQIIEDHNHYHSHSNSSKKH